MRIFISYPASAAHELADALSQALVDAGHDVLRPMALREASHRDLWSAISTAMRTSDMVIALLPVANPNVYFELGLATGANVPTLIAATTPHDIIVDLLSVPFVKLTGDLGIDVSAIVRRVRKVGEERQKPARHAGRTARALLSDAARDPSVLETLSPMEFEQLVAQLFQEQGFPVRLPRDRYGAGGDFTIDGDPPTVVEVKRYSRQNLVSVGTVRQLLGSLTATKNDRGILVSSSGFTEAARALAAETRIDLMTLDDLLAIGGPGRESAADRNAPAN